jgi:hypothetical protein
MKKIGKGELKMGDVFDRATKFKEHGVSVEEYYDESNKKKKEKLRYIGDFRLCSAPQK